MTPESLALLADLIASVGFPIFVAVYLLVTFRKTLLDNTLATKTLTDLLRLWMADKPIPQSLTERTTPPRPRL